MTAADAAWTINTTVKYAERADGGGRRGAGAREEREATDPTTLVIHYESPVGNVLAQLETFFILPEHVWQPLVGSNGKGLKTYHPELHLPIVTGGAYTITAVREEGHDGVQAVPEFLRPAVARRRASR